MIFKVIAAEIYKISMTDHCSYSDSLGVPESIGNPGRNLVRNLDYEIEEVDENEAAIVLNTIWESNKASLYIETVSLARG